MTGPNRSKSPKAFSNQQFMKSSIYLFAAFFLVLASCKDDTTPNGYKFTRHIDTGGEKAKPGEYAYVHIDILGDGQILNSTREMDRPLAMMVPDFSKMTKEDMGKDKSNPIADVVGLMAIGDSVTVEVPIDEMMRQAPQLANVKKLVYTVALLDIKNEEQYQIALEEERKAIDAQIEGLKARELEVATLLADVLKKYKSGALKPELKELETGLKYYIVEAGTGAAAQNNKQVQVHYYGILPSGQMFDNSFQRGRPYNLTLGIGEVIAGWDQGLVQLKEGDRAVLFIPSELGYGKAGNGDVIPPDSELIFYVELEKVSK